MVVVCRWKKVYREKTIIVNTIPKKYNIINIFSMMLLIYCTESARDIHTHSVKGAEDED